MHFYMIYVPSFKIFRYNCRFWRVLFFCSFRKERGTVSNTISDNNQYYLSARQSVRPFVLSFLHLACCKTKWKHIVELWVTSPSCFEMYYTQTVRTGWHCNLLHNRERGKRTRREDIATLLHSLYESTSFSALPT